VNPSWGRVSRQDIEIEIVVFSQFREDAVGLGLQNAALILTEQIAARKLALTKLGAKDPGSQISSQSE
jgi:hypothetical protein